MIDIRRGHEIHALRHEDQEEQERDHIDDHVDLALRLRCQAPRKDIHAHMGIVAERNSEAEESGKEDGVR